MLPISSQPTRNSSPEPGLLKAWPTKRQGVWTRRPETLSAVGDWGKISLTTPPLPLSRNRPNLVSAARSSMVSAPKSPRTFSLKRAESKAMITSSLGTQLGSVKASRATMLRA